MQTSFCPMARGGATGHGRPSERLGPKSCAGSGDCTVSPFGAPHLADKTRPSSPRKDPSIEVDRTRTVSSQKFEARSVKVSLKSQDHGSSGPGNAFRKFQDRESDQSFQIDMLESVDRRRLNPSSAACLPKACLTAESYVLLDHLGSHIYRPV